MFVKNVTTGLHLTILSKCKNYWLSVDTQKIVRFVMTDENFASLIQVSKCNEVWELKKTFQIKILVHFKN